ncbi:MAG: TRAP transporter substrate-binding protein DctP [Treponema sp.]|jgi:TRAP-type C4-dicarboxylate transport system substrate-binding protein|nr:TRAP transporter substrate-binding protein DctP [Treponema sp.]
MKKTFFVLIAVLTCGCLFAQRGGRGQGEVLEVKLASPLPRDSPWGKTLDQLAAEWAKATNNEVRLRILHNGQEGGEAQMLSSLSSNNIQAALFTAFGLSNICPAVMTLSVPFYIKDEAEFTAVLQEVLPLLDAQAERTDYVVAAWSKVGWVNIFSKDPVYTPDDLRKQKIASSAESTDFNTAFKTMGFQVVEAEMTDIGPKLLSGAIGAIYQNPAAVAAFQLHQTLKNMMDMPIAPALGGIAVNRVTWNRIAPARQQELIRITRRVAANFDSTMSQTVANAITAMSRSGLKVNHITEANQNLWRTEVQKAVPSLLGTVFDRDVYQKIGEVLDRRRNGR